MYHDNDGPVDETLLTPGIAQWLERHRFLDFTFSGAPSVWANGSGYHILVASLTLAGSGLIPWPKTWSPAYRNLTQTAMPAIFASEATDGCSCACSSSGCLPLTTHLKAVAVCGSDSWVSLWEGLCGEKAREVLRFLTFEALEITHTCCKHSQRNFLRVLPSGTMELLTLRRFQGSVEDIHDEEKELHGRLKQLLLEFNDRLAESGEGLRGFVWGYSRKRMAEECVPALGEGQDIRDELGVKPEEKCELLRLEDKMRLAQGETEGS